MDNLLKIYPKHYRAYYILAKINYKNKNYKNAYLLARQTLSFNPNFKKAKRLIIKIYLELGKAREAKEFADELNLSLDKIRQEKVR
jgi:tetratricopeptide (TPR) repeat protein